MNKINRKIIFLILCSGTIWTNYFTPTLEQWKSFEGVAASVNFDLYKKIAKKRKIKESMIESPKLVAVKSVIMAALNGWNNILLSDDKKTVELYDGWGREPVISQKDAEVLLIKVIESGDSIALDSFLQMTKNRSFDINQSFNHGYHYFTQFKKSMFVKNVHCYSQYNPLSLATACKQLGIITMLLQYGADVNYKDNSIVNAPLSVAIERNDLALVEILIRHGARLDSHKICD